MTYSPQQAPSPLSSAAPSHSVDAFVSVANAADQAAETATVAESENVAESQSVAKSETIAEGQASADVVVSDYFRRKHRIDWWLTLALLLVAMPVIAVTSLAILLLDGRPIFFRQVRVGRGGRTFKIWKFRSMRPNAEQFTGAVWSNRSDPRVTRLGRWLRCCHLDELPQFFNVMRGEMNLIGPRPERPEFVKELSRELPDYIHRTDVRPGITGLAQLRLGYDEQISEVRKKVRLDLRYIRTATLRLDVSLLAWTVPYLVHQILGRMVASLKQRSFTDKACTEPEPLVSPSNRLEISRQAKAAPHFSVVDQRSESKSGTSKRCSA